MRAMFAAVEEPERRSLLASLMADLGTDRAAGHDRAATAEQVDVLAKKLVAVEKQKAELEDAVRVARSDLLRRDKHWEAEQARGEELQKVVESQRTRIDAMQKELSLLETQLVARNNELHQAELKIEELTVTGQRADRSSVDQARLEELERGRVELAQEVERVRAQMDRLRQDKDAEIARLQEEHRGREAKTAEHGEDLMGKVWQRLAAAKPPLVEGHLQPNPQVAERLADSYIALVKLLWEFDKSMRLFLGRCAKDSPSLRVQWEAYDRKDDFHQFARKALAPTGGIPVGSLRSRLGLFYEFVYDATVASDAVLESVESALEDHLKEYCNSAGDPNRKIRDFVKTDEGPGKFAQQLRELRSSKIAEIFGRWQASKGSSS